MFLKLCFNFEDLESFLKARNANLLITKYFLGYKWERELIFRCKLTMHTSYDRKDNHEPAPVTALCTSKDHKTIYAGDSRGRVFAWHSSDKPGQARADHWVRDENVDSCKACQIKFTFSERKHHCRDCGLIFCNNCTRYEIEIPRLNIRKQVRVCQSCYNQISRFDITSPVNDRMGMLV